MMEGRKKFLSCLLTLALVLTLFQVPALGVVSEAQAATYGIYDYNKEDEPWVTERTINLKTLPGDPIDYLNLMEKDTEQTPEGKITWTTSNAKVVKLDKNFQYGEARIEYVGEGSAVIKAKVNGVVKASCTINVINREFYIYDPETEETLDYEKRVNLDALEGDPWEYVYLDYEGEGSVADDGDQVTWISSNPNVAAIDESYESRDWAKITYVDSGWTKISAILYGDVVASFRLILTKDGEAATYAIYDDGQEPDKLLTSFDVNLGLWPGDPYGWLFVDYGKYGDKDLLDARISWSSSNKDVVAVDNEYAGYGNNYVRVKFIGVGEADLTAKLNGKEIASIPVTLTLPKAKIPSVEAEVRGKNKVWFGWDQLESSEIDIGRGYRVYYKKAGWKSWKTLEKETFDYSVTKGNLTAGASYTFKVVPFISVGEKQFNLPAAAKSTSIYVINKVDKPIVKKSAKGKVKVSWKKTSGITGYQVAKANKKYGKYTVVKTVKKTTNSCKISAKKNKQFYYKVRAYKTVKGKKIYGAWSDARVYKLK